MANSGGPVVFVRLKKEDVFLVFVWFVCLICAQKREK